MKEYPKKIYVSMSWKNSDFPLSKFIVDKFIDCNLTIVGDHPEYQQDDPVDRSWITRIHDSMKDCSALVIIFPKKDNQQTTSPFMFPELLSASIHNIPILVFKHQGVDIKINPTKIGFNLHFGDNPQKKVLTALDFLKGKKKIEEIDNELNKIATLRLKTDTIIEGPYTIPGQDDIKQICEAFYEQNIKSVSGSFIFNIIPFSMRKKEHIVIAKSVFRETGLRCQIALDHIGESQNMRGQWEELLKNSEFIIADFSQIRDACLFEIGVAMGMGKQIFLLSKTKAPKLPYGLDNLPLITYDSVDELKTKVETICCKKYKRKVYNFAPEIFDERLNKDLPMGIPKWYLKGINKINPLTFFSISSWLLSVSLAIIIWSIFKFSNAIDTTLTYISMIISFVFGLSSFLRESKQFFESKLLDKVRLILLGTVSLFIVSIGLLIFAYLRVKT